MPVTLDWYDETRIIFIWRYIGKWTLDEGAATVQQLQNLTKQVSGRYDVISDFLEAAYTPPTGILWDWQQAAAKRHTIDSNWGLSVLVTQSSVHEAYILAGIKSSPIIQQHYRVTKSVEDAVKIIEIDRAKTAK